MPNNSRSLQALLHLFLGTFLVPEKWCGTVDVLASGLTLHGIADADGAWRAASLETPFAPVNTRWVGTCTKGYQLTSSQRCQPTSSDCLPSRWPDISIGIGLGERNP